MLHYVIHTPNGIVNISVISHDEGYDHCIMYYDNSGRDQGTIIARDRQDSIAYGIDAGNLISKYVPATCRDDMHAYVATVYAYAADPELAAPGPVLFCN